MMLLVVSLVSLIFVGCEKSAEDTPSETSTQEVQ